MNFLRPFILSLGLLLGGCGTFQNSPDQERKSTSKSDWDAPPESPELKRKLGFGSIIGEEGLVFGGKNVEGRNSQAIGSINVYLWRASLATVEFLPLASTDALGGVIITDWYHPEGEQNTQLKVAVYILGSMLEAQSLKVVLYKRVKHNAQWVEATADSKVARDLENLILSRARHLRITPS